LDASFFSDLDINPQEIITKMDEWDIINNNRENTYNGTRINIQRNLTTLEALEFRMKTDKTIADNIGT